MRGCRAQNSYIHCDNVHTAGGVWSERCWPPFSSPPVTPCPLPDGDEETGSGVPPDMETAVTHTAHTSRAEHRPNVANFPRRAYRECQIPPLCNSWTLFLYLKKKGCKGCRLLEAAHPRFGYTKFTPISDNENSANTSAIRSRGFIVLFGKLLYDY